MIRITPLKSTFNNQDLLGYYDHYMHDLKQDDSNHLIGWFESHGSYTYDLNHNNPDSNHNNPDSNHWSKIA